MPRAGHPTGSCNVKILNKAKVNRQKYAEAAKKQSREVYSGPIDDTSMEIRAGEIVARLPDGSVTSALNGCPVTTEGGKIQPYPILGVAIATSTPNPATRDPHTMANVAIAGSVPVRNVGNTTFSGGDEVFAVYPAIDNSTNSTIRTGRGRDSSQVKLFSLVKGTSSKPILHALLKNTAIQVFWLANYVTLRTMAQLNGPDHLALLKSLINDPKRTLETEKKNVKLLLKELKLIIEALRAVFTMTRGHRLGVVEENKQAFPGEEMSVYITPPH